MHNIHTYPHYFIKKKCIGTYIIKKILMHKIPEIELELQEFEEIVIQDINKLERR